MEKLALEVLKGAWPTVQAPISMLLSMIVSRLFLRSNIEKAEIVKIKSAKFAEVANALLNGGHITHYEFNKFKNFNEIALKADSVYQQKHAASFNNRSVDTENEFTIDWFLRFYEDASNISDEQMQELWAKVLAGEIHQPGSFSLRSLDTLRNLSKTEAETIQTIASFALPINGGCYLSIDEELQRKYYYNVNSLQEMYDCGIIDNSPTSHYLLTMNSASVFMQFGSLLCISQNREAENYSLDMQRFTKTGSEFIRLVKPNEEYLIDFFDKLNKEFPKLKLVVQNNQR